MVIKITEMYKYYGQGNSVVAALNICIKRDILKRIYALTLDWIYI